MTDLSRMLVAGKLSDESHVIVGVNAAGLTYHVTKQATHQPMAGAHTDVSKRLRLDALNRRESEMSDDMEE